ncbi:MBL fold metallo-hydrolase [Acidipila sp. EB88]|uniref:MBL fold metallo-hydrolase n=1 Tax=Acidipila sp. EB88 TaxID=2305226 RepID=UPI001F28D1B4|nr:MBL fold metallo-hydrolase [Acidipila sp. EB88]
MLPKVFYQYLRNQEERVPRQTPGPFRTDPRIFEQPPSSGLRISWFGHSSTLVEIDGVRVLIDPVWDERAAPVQWAGPRRFFPPTLPLAELPRIDVVLISHDHYDHLGAGTVRLLAKQDATAHAWWVTPLGVGAFLQSLGVPAARLQELDWTGSVSIRGLKITALPSRHFSGRSLWNRFHTLWASFVLEGPSHRVFYGADSGEWPGFAEIGQQFGPFDLTMLEIGAFHPLWSDIHMGPEGAVRSFQGLGGGGLLMPIHWGLFDLALHGWRQPIDRISSHGALKLWSPTPGEPTEVQAGVELRSTWWRQS